MKDHVAIITGGSRGIGAGISKAFTEKGYSVVINYFRNEESAHSLKRALEHSDGSILLVKADISTSAGRKKLVDETLSRFGKIDILVNNAGIAARGSFLKGTEDEFDSIIDTNLKGPIFLAQACAQHMIEKNIKGRIINISSISAHVPNAPTSYAVSKAGLVAATKTMALKLAQYGIRVNTVSPGTIKSDMNRRIWHDNPELWNEVTRSAPLGRAGEPHELASAILYLASNDSSFITGTELIVDGGWMLKPSW
ncbi:MAG: SDR family oxidoreductase [Gammaproteobacteria bacterium]|nr:SDR family oxidoreductase [Gammaproteobacteria bacterium]